MITDELTGDVWEIEALAPDAEESFTATMENAEAGSIENVAVVTWEDNDEIDDAEEPDEITSASDDETVDVKIPEPPATEPPATEPEPDNGIAVLNDNFPIYADDDNVYIPDEDVPLADAPKTGDISVLWAAMSVLSAGGMAILSVKRKDEE